MLTDEGGTSRHLPALSSHISGRAIPARNCPSTVQAIPSLTSLGSFWKPVSEPCCSGGWKTSSNFLTMFISDQLIRICSSASPAFCLLRIYFPDVFIDSNHDPLILLGLTSQSLLVPSHKTGFPGPDYATTLLLFSAPVLVRIHLF